MKHVIFPVILMLPLGFIMAYQSSRSVCTMKLDERFKWDQSIAVSSLVERTLPQLNQCRIYGVLSAKQALDRLYARHDQAMLLHESNSQRPKSTVSLIFPLITGAFAARSAAFCVAPYNTEPVAAILFAAFLLAYFISARWIIPRFEEQRLVEWRESVPQALLLPEPDKDVTDAAEWIRDELSRVHLHLKTRIDVAHWQIRVSSHARTVIYTLLAASAILFAIQQILSAT